MICTVQRDSAGAGSEDPSPAGRPPAPDQLVGRAFEVRHQQTSAGDGVAPPSHACLLNRLGEAQTVISRQQRQIHQLENDRDALAEEVGQTFEELHCLRVLSHNLSDRDMTTTLSDVAENVLPELRELIRAEAVALVPAGAPSGTSRLLPFRRSNELPIVWTGSRRIESLELRTLIDQLDRQATVEPVIFNRDARYQPACVTTTLRNLIAVGLSHQQHKYGWLIAINRISSQPSGLLPSDLHSCQFGTRDVGLLKTAATMLAGHARNAELFRAEERLRLGVIETMTGALDARDPYTCGHSRRVGQFAVTIAERLGLAADKCEQLYVTGLLHDVGKIGVPDDVLKKPSRLTDEEFDVIKQHPTIGHTILSPLYALEYVLPGVLHHHERIDGGGYPHGLAGDEIPLDARILAVADGYDAMTSNRAYRNAMPQERALEILQDGAGRQWDCDVVQVFVTAQSK